LLGYQSILFAILSKTFATTVGLLPKDPRLDRFFAFATLEKGIVLGLGALASGMALIALPTSEWIGDGFGPLDYPKTLRFVIPGVTLAALGFQTILSGFFVSILGMSRR
jgi:hypothetical protein